MSETNFEKDLQELLINYTPNPRLRCVGRLSHNRYMKGSKLVSQSTFTLLEHKSQLSLSDMILDGPDLDIANLELENHEEGLYEIVCRLGEDWELELIPYKEEIE